MDSAGVATLFRANRTAGRVVFWMGVDGLLVQLPASHLTFVSCQLGKLPTVLVSEGAYHELLCPKPTLCRRRSFKIPNE